MIKEKAYLVNVFLEQDRLKKYFKNCKILTLNPLKFLSSAFLPRFFSFLFSGIAAEAFGFLKYSFSVFIALGKRSGEPKFDRIGLAGQAAAVGLYDNIKFIEIVREFQGY